MALWPQKCTTVWQRLGKCWSCRWEVFTSFLYLFVYSQRGSAHKRGCTCKKRQCRTSCLAGLFFPPTNTFFVIFTFYGDKCRFQLGRHDELEKYWRMCFCVAWEFKRTFLLTSIFKGSHSIPFSVQVLPGISLTWIHFEIIKKISVNYGCNWLSFDVNKCQSVTIFFFYHLF